MGKKKKRVATLKMKEESEGDCTRSASYPSGVRNASKADSEYDGPCTRLWSLNSRRLSIGWAKLKMARGDVRCIYGSIHLNNGFMSKAVTLYSRSSELPEEVRSDWYLTLCGPRYSLAMGDSGFLYVDLREKKGGAPFIRQKVPLSLAKRPESESFTVKAAGVGGTLTISMTPVMPSVLTRVCVKLLNVDPCEDWSVYGTVQAIQTLSGCPEKRIVTLFRRLKSDPISLANAPALRWGAPDACPTLTRNIALDRDVVVAPVHFGDALARRVRKMALEGYCEHPNGADSSFAVSVHLNFVFTADPSIRSCVKGLHTFQLQGTDGLGELYWEYMKAPIKLQKKKQQRHDKNKDKDKGFSDTAGSSPSTKNLKIIALVTSFSDFFDKKRDEPYECDLPLNLDS